MALNSSLSEGSMAGDYRIVRKLAEGGMGEVFLVHDAAQETCVLKSVLCASNGDAKEALKEAKVLKDIRHPHVVQYLDVFPNQEAYKGIIAVCTVMSDWASFTHSGTVRTLEPISRPMSQQAVMKPSMTLRCASLARASCVRPSPGSSTSTSTSDEG